jgi:flagellar motor switch/type III secretory pathway protein FliN
MKDQNNALRALNDADIQTWYAFLDLSVQLAVELGRTKLTAR